MLLIKPTLFHPLWAMEMRWVFYFYPLSCPIFGIVLEQI